MMYGWRARIGRLTPNTAIEGVEEWRRWAPEGVVIMPSLIPCKSLHLEDLRVMMEHVEQAAVMIADAHPNVIIQCCAPGTFIEGATFDEQVIERIQRATGVQATTMQRAAVDALTHLDLKRIVLASPYRDELNERLADYLETVGIDVVAHRGMQAIDPKGLPYMSPAGAYEISKQVFREAPNADGIYFSGGGYRTFEIIDALERDTGVPVVTGNQAAFWKVLRMCGVNDTIPDLGKLLAN